MTAFTAPVARVSIPRWFVSPQALTALILLLSAALLASIAQAAGTGGEALQATFNMVNDMVNGYGKQLIIVIGFVLMLIGYLAANATSVVLRFVGLAIFSSVALPAALAIAGALV